MIAAAFLTLASIPANVFAQATPQPADGIAMQQEAQRKLMAQRAARADAIRQLAERIKGLRITSETTVNDFVTDNDNIETSLRAWLLGMKEEGKYKHFEDGTCSIEMSVMLNTITAKLTSLYKAYYKGDKIKLQQMENLQTESKLDKITVVGHGAMPEELSDDGAVGGDINAGPEPRKLAIPEIWKLHCTGQGRLMAARAARVDALRRLAERIKGLRVDSETTVNDFVADNDTIETRLNAALTGAKEVRVKYLKHELICEVTMQVKLKTILATLRSAVDAEYKDDRVKMKRLDDYVENVRIDTIEETGSACPPARYVRGYSPQQVAVMGQVSGTNVPDWATQTLTVTGQAALDTKEYPNEAQAKLMALRAAELVARRKLAERVDGLRINSNATVKDFVGKNDTIRTRMMTYQVGAHVVEGSEKVKEGVAEVNVEMPLQPVWTSISFFMTRTAN